MCFKKNDIMTTITINDRTKAGKSFLEFAKNLTFVKFEPKEVLLKADAKKITPSQKKWIDDLKKSILETKEVAAGKRKKQTLKSFLDEI